MEKPTSDEKVLAALAHASVIFAFFGPIGPTLIWAFQRTKSKYVRFHALQAMGYQALTFWLWFIGGVFFIFGGFFLLAILGGIWAASDPAFSDPGLFPFIIQPILIMGMFGIWGLFFLVGIIGAVFCIIDRDFHYPLIGRWLKGKLFRPEITETEMEAWEDNWVGGVCHSTAILQLWGMIIPLIVWFSQKDRSIKLRFQAMQAMLYQLIAMIIYMASMAAYMGSFFLMFAGMAILGFDNPSPPSNENMPPLLGITLFIFLAVIAIVILVMMVGGPIYILVAGIASILTVRGRDFHYPILGNLIAKRMNAPQEESIPAA